MDIEMSLLNCHSNKLWDQVLTYSSLTSYPHGNCSLAVCSIEWRDKAGIYLSSAAALVIRFVIMDVFQCDDRLLPLAQGIYLRHTWIASEGIILYIEAHIGFGVNEINSIRAGFNPGCLVLQKQSGIRFIAHVGSMDAGSRHCRTNRFYSHFLYETVLCYTCSEPTC